MSQHWLERAKRTYDFHRSKCLSDDKWNLTKTSKALKLGLGPVCEDIKIASWLRTHSKQIEQFTYRYEAMEFIRRKQREIDLADLDA